MLMKGQTRTSGEEVVFVVVEVVIEVEAVVVIVVEIVNVFLAETTFLTPPCEPEM